MNEVYAQQTQTPEEVLRTLWAELAHSAEAEPPFLAALRRESPRSRAGT